MKFIRNTILSLLSFGALLSSCSDEDVIKVVDEEYITVDVVANVSVGNDTRTTKPFGSTGLKFQWAEGDELVVISKKGSNLGVIRLNSGAGQSSGSFVGKISLPSNTDEVNIYYFGRKESSLKYIADDYTVDLSTQTGKVEDITDYDILHCTSRINVVDNKTTLDISVQSILGFAHFYVHVVEGTTPTTENISISGENFYNNVKLNLADATFATVAEGTITTGVEWKDGDKAGEGEIFMTIVPEQNKMVKTNFNLTVGEKTYNAAIEDRKYAPATIFSGGTTHGKDVYFSEDGAWTLTYMNGDEVFKTEPKTNFGPSVTFDITSEVPEKAGFSFKGWSTSDAANATVEYTATSENNTLTLNRPKTTETLYAVWEAKRYTFQFYSNDGSTMYSDGFQERNSQFNEPWIFGSFKNIDSEVMTHSEGRRLLGWANNPNATKADYVYTNDNRTAVTPELSTGGENVLTKKVYAVWKAIPTEFTVVYTDGVVGQTVFPDDGTGELKAGDPTPKFKFEDNLLERAGYVFSGWSPAVKATVDPAMANEDGVITYTATWEKASTFGVTASGAEGKGYGQTAQ